MTPVEPQEDPQPESPRPAETLERAVDKVERLFSEARKKLPPRPKGPERDTTRRCMGCNAPCRTLHCDPCHAALVAEGKLDAR